MNLGLLRDPCQAPLIEEKDSTKNNETTKNADEDGDDRTVIHRENGSDFV